MEVHGKQKQKKTFSVSWGSAEDFLLFCIPCDRDGARVPAKGYCSTCKEHLCDTCYKHHKKQTPSRHHILLDEDSMPTTPSVPIVKDEFDCCYDHEDEKLKFYCTQHDIVACSVCVTLNHRLCTVDYIPKLSKHILDSEELNEIMAEMKALEDNYKSQIKRVKDEMKAISKNHDDVIKAIHQFRKEINTRLDKMEKHVFKEADSILLKQQTKLNDLSTGVQEITDKLTEKRKHIDNLIQRKCLDKLFVEMKETKKQVEEMRMKQKQYSREDVFQTVSFVKNSDIVDILDRHKQLGELITKKTSIGENFPVMKPTSTPSEDKTPNLEVVEDIDLNSSSGSTKCNITGIEVIKPDKIFMCDNSGNNVKCYDIVQKKIVSEMKLDYSPFDVAAITDDKFAVTVPSERSIHFMSLRNQRIVSDRKVNINEQCFGIAYSQDKLVVSCNLNPGKVLVLDLQGKLLQSFSGDDSLFSFPFYVTVNTAGTSIYVSDFGYSVNAVKQLDWQGNIINTFKPAEGGTNLNGICVLNDGTFLVCLAQDSDDNLRRVSDSCKPCKIKMNKKLGSWFPGAVAYCQKSRKLYVSYSEEGCNNPRHRIKIFKVDWC